LVYAPQAEQLTKRERDILRLLTFGRTNRQISARTGLAFGTVKNYVSQLLTKLGVTDRTQAAVRAVELGLVRPADQH
jgi:DNA-binding NarL/FixJ family response regulator